MSFVKILEGINSSVGNGVRWLAIGMVLLQFIIVIARYVFGFSSIALQEGVLYMHSALFMLGAGYTLLIDKHVRVDIFYSKCSEKTKAYIDLIGHTTLLIPSLLVLLYWSYPMVFNSWKILEGAISVGGIPAIFILKSFIILFCILIIMQSIASIIGFFIKT